MVRSIDEIALIYEQHVTMIYRICFTYMKNPSDTEDAVQDTFYRLIKTNPTFKSDEHQKAWLIVVATNICKNKLKHWWRKREDYELHQNFHGENQSIDQTLEVVMGLPNKYKTVVYLYYYEGYTSVEIAEMLKKPNSTIRNHLHEARKLLKEKLGDDFHE